MRQKQSRADKAIDKRTNAAFVLACSGIPISVLKINQVFAEGRRLQLSGADDQTLMTELRQFTMTLAKETA